MLLLYFRVRKALYIDLKILDSSIYSFRLLYVNLTGEASWLQIPQRAMDTGMAQ